MTVFDFFVLVIVGASVVSGAMRGLVRALIAGAALIVGIVVAAQGYGMVGAALRNAGLVESSAAASAGGFLLLVGLIVALGFAAGSLVRRSLKHARLDWLDRILGAAFGFIRGWAVCAVIFLALTAFPVRLNSVTGALCAPVLAQGARILSVCTSTDVRTRFFDEYKRLTA